MRSPAASIEAGLLAYVSVLENRVASLSGSVGGLRAVLEETSTMFDCILKDETICPPEVAERIRVAIVSTPPLPSELARILIDRFTPVLPPSKLNGFAALCTPVDGH